MSSTPFVGSDTQPFNATVRWIRIQSARFFHAAGWPGCVGAAFLLVAVALAAEDAHVYSRNAQATVRLQAAVHTHLSNRPQRPPPPTAAALPQLPATGDIPRLLAQVEETALASGLGWSQADYKITPLNDASLSTLEIRCGLKGPYPSLRRFITELLNNEPALALRRFDLSRTSSDAPEVDAKIELVVFLSDGWSVLQQIPRHDDGNPDKRGSHTPPLPATAANGVAADMDAKVHK